MGVTVENTVIQNNQMNFVLVPMPSDWGLADVWLQGWADLKYKALDAKSAGDKADLGWLTENHHLIPEDLRGTTTLVFRDATETIQENRPLLTFGVLSWGGERWVASALAFKTTVITQGFALVLRLAPV